MENEQKPQEQPEDEQYSDKSPHKTVENWDSRPSFNTLFVIIAVIAVIAVLLVALSTCTRVAAPLASSGGGDILQRNVDAAFSVDTPADNAAPQTQPTTPSGQVSPQQQQMDQIQQQQELLQQQEELKQQQRDQVPSVLPENVPTPAPMNLPY